MIIPRAAQIGAAILALGVAVVWMLPPTTPVAPPIKPTRPVAAHRAAPPSPAPFDSNSLDAVSGTSVPPPLPPLPAPAPLPEPSPAADRVPREEPADTAADQLGQLDDPDREFDAGYRWAERNDVQDEEGCRVWRGTPREDGCLAYVEDAPGPDDAERPPQ